MANVSARDRRVVELRERGLLWKQIAAEIGMSESGLRRVYDRAVVAVRRERQAAACAASAAGRAPADGNGAGAARPAALEEGAGRMRTVAEFRDWLQENEARGVKVVEVVVERDVYEALLKEALAILDDFPVDRSSPFDPPDGKPSLFRLFGAVVSEAPADAA